MQNTNKNVDQIVKFVLVVLIILFVLHCIRQAKKQGFNEASEMYKQQNAEKEIEKEMNYMNVE